MGHVVLPPGRADLGRQRRQERPAVGGRTEAAVGGQLSTLGYAFGVVAVPRIGSRLASFIGLSEVLFALGFAWIFLGEIFDF